MNSTTTPAPARAGKDRTRGPSPEKTAQTRCALIGAALSELL